MMTDLNQLRRTVSTAEAAKYLNREPQTLRAWACRGNGPIKPIRINGRLAWPVDELAALLSPADNDAINGAAE